MKIIYSEKHTLHNPPYELYDGVQESYAEKPARIELIVQKLRSKKDLFSIQLPKHFSQKYIDAVHDKRYREFLENRCKKIVGDDTLQPSFYMTDTYTPLQKGTYEAAREAVDVALTGALLLKKEKTVYALCRPPGHHAEKDRMGGYCYFNNAAIAANYLSKFGRVAILDVDFHHGNGTQEIFYDRADVLYVSIHADPSVRFPYVSGRSFEAGIYYGKGFNKNYPLQLGTTNDKYIKTLKRALRDVKKFSPQFLVVSTGFDTYEKDPIGGFKLTIPFYKTMGKEINHLNLPTLIVQEGGYAVDVLGNIAFQFLQGFM